MSADDDTFDIDIYGDDVQDFSPDEFNADGDMQGSAEDVVARSEEQAPISENATNKGQLTADTGIAQAPSMAPQDTGSQPVKDKSSPQQAIASSLGTSAALNAPKQAPIQQGLKRPAPEDGSDTRPTDPGATAALKLMELNWWTTEEDLRGWANQAGCEDEVTEITFSEHKINGKSRGEAIIELASPQAATALKQRIDSFCNDQPSHVKKYGVHYASPQSNPFKTYPKDGPGRQNNYKQNDNRSVSSGSIGGYGAGTNGGYNNRGGYGGGRGNFQNRGGMAGGFGNARNYAGGPNTGFNAPMQAGFNPMMAGAMGFNRGGMAGMNMMGRGGFGGMNRGGAMGMGGVGNMRGGMPMGNMGMGMGMGMNNAAMGGGGMQGGFAPNMGGQAGYWNPNFNFNGGGATGSSPIGGQNPHGNKRPKME